MSTRSIFDPSDFADWDEGKLSTNKAFQKIKAAQEQAERDRRMAEMERDNARNELAEAYRTNELLETQIGTLKQQVAEKPKPEVIERKVVQEVAPKDYQDTKRKIKELEHLERIHGDDNKNLRRQLEETRKELDKAKGILGMDENMQDVRRDVKYLITATNQYVRRYGGLTWTVQQLSEVDEPTLNEFKKAIKNLATFSSALVESMRDFGDR